MHTLIQDAFNWRYAVKKFDPSKKISAEDFNTLLSSLEAAPSSLGLQPYRFVIVENPEVRAKLREVSWNQSQVTDADKYVVILAHEKPDTEMVQKYLTRIAEVRGVPPESLQGYKDMMIGFIATTADEKLHTWAQRQSYIAMGFLLETAALLKIDATPMEGFDPLAYDKILGLEGSGWKTVATVALGYRHSDDTFQSLKKVRLSRETLVQHIK